MVCTVGTVTVIVAAVSKSCGTAAVSGGCCCWRGAASTAVQSGVPGTPTQTVAVTAIINI